MTNVCVSGPRHRSSPVGPLEDNGSVTIFDRTDKFSCVSLPPYTSINFHT